MAVSEGVKFIYLGYYYADDSGTTQLVAFTSPKLVAENKQDIYEFLNGLVKQPSQTPNTR